jgi:5-methyltetrahydropteroyltriglutamate--homocysteine methyltransferase
MKPPRILTTHCGSLPRPKDLLDLMKARINGEPGDAAEYDASIRNAVAGIVRQQLESGIDIPTDGEQSKPGFFAYVNERLAGFEPRPGPRPTAFQAEVEAFPEYYKQYFSQAMLGNTLAPPGPLRVYGPSLLSGRRSGAPGHRKSPSRAARL